MNKQKTSIRLAHSPENPLTPNEIRLLTAYRNQNQQTRAVMLSYMEIGAASAWGALAKAPALRLVATGMDQPKQALCVAGGVQ